MVLERSELTPSDELIVYRATLAWAEAVSDIFLFLFFMPKILR